VDKKVLIVGAGGSIGTIGVQLASTLGGSDGCRQHGETGHAALDWADHVIDTRRRISLQSGQTYDVILM